MDTAAEALLIVVSSVLSVFLVVAIIAGIKAIQVLNILKRLAEKAENLADSAEAAGELLRKSVSKFAFGRFMSNIVKSASKHNKDQ